jgi:hypothetical protein
MDRSMAKPTLDTYAEWTSDHLNRSIGDIGRSTTEIAARHNAKGAYRSGATIIVTYREAHEHFEKGLKAALGELKRAGRITDIDAGELRAKTEDLLRDYAEKAKTATRPDVLRQFAGPRLVDERIAMFDQKLDFALKHFDAGFLDPAEPEPPPSMSMTVGTMIGGAVQQGTVSSAQHVSTSIDLQAARAAALHFGQTLAASEISQSLRSELRADLDTIKAQLGKEQPSSGVLKEAGKSLRTMTENLMANVLSGPTAAALVALWKALGVG